MKCDGAYKEVKACSCHYEMKALTTERDALKAEQQKLISMLEAQHSEISRLKGELEDYKFQTKHAVDLWKAEATKWRSVAMGAKRAIDGTRLDWQSKLSKSGIYGQRLCEAALAAFPKEGESK